MLGSSFVLRLIERFPVIIKLGAAVLAFTAAKMIVGEPLLDPLFDPAGVMHDIARVSTYVLAIAGVLGLGWWSARRTQDVAVKSSHVPS
mgnify:CR=1 FL=1